MNRKKNVFFHGIRDGFGNSIRQDRFLGGNLSDPKDHISVPAANVHENSTT